MADEPDQDKTEEQEDLSLLAAVGRGEEAVQRLDERTATVEHLLGNVETLAHGLDPDALLGLSEWALKNERWPELLRLVRTAESVLALARRLTAWYRLLEHGLRAARALNDRAAEAWLEGQLGAAAAALERPAESQLHLRRASRIRRELEGKRPRLPSRLADLADRAAAVRSVAPPLSLGIVGLTVAAGAGLAVGFSVFHNSSAKTAAVAASSLTITETSPGKTTTLSGTTVTRFTTTTRTVVVPPTASTSTSSVPASPNVDGFWYDNGARIVIYHADDGSLVAVLLGARRTTCPPSSGQTVGRNLQPSGGGYTGEWDWADAVPCGSDVFAPATMALADPTSATVVVQPPATATEPAQTVTLTRSPPPTG